MQVRKKITKIDEYLLISDFNIYYTYILHVYIYIYIYIYIHVIYLDKKNMFKYFCLSLYYFINLYIRLSNASSGWNTRRDLSINATMLGIRTGETAAFRSDIHCSRDIISSISISIMLKIFYRQYKQYKLLL